GGYSFSLLSVLLVGVLLDLLAPDGAAALDDYRLALSSMGVLMGAAALGLLLTTRRRAGDSV
ncbi:MAG: MFS transporter, partial [Brachybacterium sp.]